MALVALVTAARVNVVESIMQLTLPAEEAIVAGAPCRIVVTDSVAGGKWTNANGTVAGEAVARGIAVRSVAAGEPLTCIRLGVMDGWDFTTLPYDSAIFVSDTDGRLDTAAGTVSQTVGRIIPGTATLIGTKYDKLLHVNLV